MPCDYMLYDKCLNGHQQQWKCKNGRPNVCLKCEREKKLAEKRRKEQFALQEKRDREQREHERQLADVDAKIAQEREAIRDAQLAEERKNALLQKERDLKDAVSLAAQATRNATSVASQSASAPPASSFTPAVALQNSVPVSQANASPTPLSQPAPSTLKLPTAAPAPPPLHSAAKVEWERQKTMEGATNDALDAIMAMTGLERVKSQVLDIKASVDTAKRQGTSLAKNRYNLSCLGNPGTGKHS
jgi:hypothetical protein